MSTDAILARWGRAGSVFRAVFLVLFAMDAAMVLSGMPRIPVLGFIAFAAILGSLTCVVVRESLTARYVRQAAAQAAIGAAHERQRRLVRHYQRYLADPA